MKRFLFMKLRFKGMVKITKKSVKKLTPYEKWLMNKTRGRDGRKDFNKDYPDGTIFFFVKDNDKIKSFGGLEPVTINYLGKSYDILGICNIFSVEKGKGYGTILIKNMIEDLKKKGKTGLGFTGKKTAEFYKKAGLKVLKDFSLRLEMENPRTKERIPDPDGGCPGVYYEGKDKLISKMLKGNSIATYWLPRLKEPHF